MKREREVRWGKRWRGRGIGEKNKKYGLRIFFFGMQHRPNISSANTSSTTFSCAYLELLPEGAPVLRHQLLDSNEGFVSDGCVLLVRHVLHNVLLAAKLLQHQLPTWVVPHVLSAIVRSYGQNNRVGRRLEQLNQDLDQLVPIFVETDCVLTPETLRPSELASRYHRKRHRTFVRTRVGGWILVFRYSRIIASRARACVCKALSQ